MIRILALVACLWPTLATAQSWPVYENVYVNDYARLLPEDVETRIKRQLEVLREDTGVEATVLTLNTRGGFTPTDTMEDFATGLFNEWGIGDAARNDGILILVLRDDREMRIELGSGYGSGFNREAQDIIDRVFLPEFRNDNYADGIEDGTDAVITRIARAHWNGQEPPERNDSNGDIVAWIIGILAVVGGVVAAFSRKIIDRFRTCPECGERGLNTLRNRLRAPTRTSTGRGEKITDCPHCGYHSVVPYTIPRVTSSSSSGGSFGGGSSSGGGASGRW
ncbi:MAG: TPM domain-containing protein [Pseudomonadota bacterium]|nr:TPM domain-containing protein [Pseudomonadota bacterium]